jgi:hypothetical protein
MMKDDDAIRAVIRTYFECMHESSAGKTHAAFHPDARITGFLDGDLAAMSVDQFAAMVEDHQPSPAAQGVAERLDVLEIHLAGDTAVARVRDDYMGLTFLDTLTFLKLDGDWRIHDKLFHVEGPAAS